MISNFDIQKFSYGLNFKRKIFSNIYQGESFILLSQFILKDKENSEASEARLRAKRFGESEKKNDELVEFLEKNYPKINLEDLLEKTEKWLEKEITEAETNLLFLKLPEEQNKEVYFSSLGDIKAYLIQDDKIPVKGGSALAGQAASGKDLSHETSVGKFGHLTSGHLSGNDVLIFTTPEIPPPVAQGALGGLRSSVAQGALKDPRQNLSKLVKKSGGGAILMIKNKSFKELFDEFTKEKKEDNLPLDDLSRLEKPKFGFPSLTYLQKSLVVLLIIVLLLFIRGLFNAKNKKEIKKEFSEETLILIQQKEEEIIEIASLKDKEKIYNLLSELEVFILNLSPNTSEEKEIFQKLENTYFDNLKKFYFYISLDDPKLVVNLELFDKKFLPEKIINIESHLYTFDPSNNYLYQIDAISGKISLLSQSPPGLSHLNQIFGFDKDNFLVSDEKGNLASYNLLNQELKPIKIERSHPDSPTKVGVPTEVGKSRGIKDFVIYTNRLYTLEEKEIYRFRKTDEGFGKEEQWLKEDFDLKNAKAMTIDGDIYILKDNEVFKFYQGKKENFKLENILPKIKNLTSISAPLNLNNLYLLEQNRLLIFDKSGKLIKQILSPKFTNLKGFAISQDGKKVWLLEGQKIYQIEIK